VSKKTKLVRLSRTLEDDFDALPHKDQWLPTGFPEFVRDAVREKLDREKVKAQLGIVEREEPGPHR
jgi:hypothetical protein